METPAVYNVRVKYIRPEYKNLKEWCADPNNVYIGRPGIVFIDGKRYPAAKDCLWGNPFKVSTDGSDRDAIVDQYYVYIKAKVQSDSKMAEELRNLHGKKLGCWCHPEKCHGDALVKLYSEMFG